MVDKFDLDDGTGNVTISLDGKTQSLSLNGVGKGQAVILDINHASSPDIPQMTPWMGFNDSQTGVIGKARAASLLDGTHFRLARAPWRPSLGRLHLARTRFSLGRPTLSS